MTWFSIQNKLISEFSVDSDVTFLNIVRFVVSCCCICHMDFTMSTSIDSQFFNYFVRQNKLEEIFSTQTLCSTGAKISTFTEKNGGMRLYGLQSGLLTYVDSSIIFVVWWSECGGGGGVGWVCGWHMWGCLSVWGGCACLFACFVFAWIFVVVLFCLLVFCFVLIFILVLFVCLFVFCLMDYGFTVCLCILLVHSTIIFTAMCNIKTFNGVLLTEWLQLFFTLFILFFLNL